VDRQEELAGEVHDLRVQIARLGQAPNWYEEGLRRDTNLELLKAEVRSLERSVLELGMQLAPATGLAGVGARMGELREQVNAVSRRTQQIDQALRRLSERGPPGTVTDARDGAVVAPQTAAPQASAMDLLFDYVAFERRFRGSPEEILAVQSERYADLLAEHAPVLDWGCGRGELLELLASRGVDVVGVEIDGGMVSEARSRGLTVHQVDAVSYLSTCEPESLGAVFSAHVAEHIPFEALLEVIHASLRALRPGGVFVAETPNPTSLVVPSNSFILDPTHLRPIHPSLFAFACETAGFRDVRLTFYSPATGYHVPKLDEDGTDRTTRLNAAIDRLNEVLFGPQEYSIEATKAGAEG
jgi:SAM-dependent methyltransferase